MKDYIFKFKRFQVSHSKSAMKVGVDSVLLGAWASVESSRRLLDVGCGCGILSLMCAQRNEHAVIDGIEIEPQAASEAAMNFRNSPWSARLNLIQGDFLDRSVQLPADNYDYIISNPPYFDSGVEAETSARNRARHQGRLSPLSLLETARNYISVNGIVGMILPLEIGLNLINESSKAGYQVRRLCKIKHREELPYKRILIEFEKACNDENAEEFSPVESSLILENTPGEPSEAHRELCKDFYLKF